jgi:hypothetical protein
LLHLERHLVNYGEEDFEHRNSGDKLILDSDRAVEHEDADED